MSNKFEIIELSKPVEQTKTVQYGDRTIKFNIRWNNIKSYWYVDIYENNTPIYTGVTMTINTNLLYDTLRLGKLFLIDTKYGKTSDVIKKSDLGSRLQLVRIFEE